MQIPFFEAVSQSRVILLAGVGGGFDIASGIPLYLYFRRMGMQVVLANLSFARLQHSGSEEICQGTYRVTRDSRDMSYFPEKLILEWLALQGETPEMYGFSNELGVLPLATGYAEIVARHDVDTLVLVDGGTDSLMCGDESGVATLVEDACSLVAAAVLGMERSFLVATAFGVEYFHKLNHHACLENVSTLIKDDAYLGAISLTKDMRDGKSFIELVNYLNVRQASQTSIVANAISDAMKGEFGDTHASDRARGSKQFVNPLMGLFWFFKLDGVVSRLGLAPKIAATETMNDVAKAFQLFRATTVRRAHKEIPL